MRLAQRRGHDGFAWIDRAARKRHLTGVLAKAGAAHRDLTVAQFGDASVTKELDDSQASDQQRSQMISMSVTLLILLVTFGALLAAAVPVILALTAVAGTADILRGAPEAREWSLATAETLAEESVDGQPDRSEFLGLLRRVREWHTASVARSTPY